MTDLAREAGCSMTATERVKLLDAATQSHSAGSYLASVQRSFDDADRHGDAVVAGVLMVLLWAGEIEIVMSMRTEWLGRLPAP